MVSSELTWRVKQATLSLESNRGHGVLIPGHLIITAARWFEEISLEELPTERRLLEKMTTAKEQHLETELCHADFVSGIAILKPSEDDHAAVHILAEIQPLSISREIPERGKIMSVWIWPTGASLGDRDACVEAEVEACEGVRSGYLRLEAKQELGCHLSGSVVADKTGSLLGLLSLIGRAPEDADDEPTNDRVATVLDIAYLLPFWAWVRISPKLQLPEQH